MTTAHHTRTCRRCGGPIRHGEPTVRGLHVACVPADLATRRGTRRTRGDRRAPDLRAELRPAA